MNRHRTLFIAAAMLSTVLWTLSCGDGGTKPPPPDPPRPTTVTVSPASSQLTALDATVQLRAEVLDQNGQVVANATVSWSSSAAAVAAVDGSGLVTAAGNGAATITATAGSASGTAAVTVMQAVSAVEVSPAAATVLEGDTLRLVAEAADANGHVVAGAEFLWASSDETVAMVDAAGLVTGVGAGEAEVAASSSGVVGRAELLVELPVATTVTVAPDTLEFTELADTIRLMAEVLDQIGRVMAGEPVLWTSGDTMLVTVDSAGLVTAAGNGAATITATAGSASGTAAVTVMQAVSAVEVSPAAATVLEGDTLRLVAEAADANGHVVAGAEFLWASSDETVAMVNATGLVTGVGAGAVEVTASSSGVVGRAELLVEGPVATTVTVAPDTLEFTALADTMRLMAEVLDQIGRVMAGEPVLWSSGDTMLATVDSAGLVTAAGNGAATITATAGSASGTAAVTVMQAVSAVEVSPAAATVLEGDTLRLVAEAADANGHVVAGAEFLWASSDETVAMVNATGLVTGVGAGAVEVTASSSGVVGRAELLVEGPVATTVTVAPDTLEFTALADTMRLMAEVLDQIGRVMAGEPVLWSSGDTMLATVDSAGLVTAAGNGAATITAAAGSASGTAAVTVMQAAASAVVTRPVDTIAPADTLRFAAEAYDQNGHRVEGAEFTWSSSAVTVATVDGSGLVQGVGEGVATITAMAGSAQGTTEITVENPDRAVLAALYHATDGPNWGNNDGWLTDAPLGDWYGVNTDRFGRVVGLNLSSRWDPEAQEIVRQGLSGPIPVELASLTRLERLNFWVNNLTGPIPPELGSLTNLRVLWLSSNSLSGPIPPELGNLANLAGLSLGGNALIGAIPPELGGLSNLTQLHLRGAALTGPIPPELGDLANLRELYLGGNALTGPIPSELGNLANLTELYLDGNALTGPIPRELGNLANLRRLVLSRNGFVSLPPGVFGELSHLSELYLANNRLDSLPPGAFLGLSSLRILDLEGNPGSPFSLTLELVRTDNDTLDAPGPAGITAQVAEGAPFAMPIPLSVEGGDLSADTLTLGAGSASSAEVTVARNEAGAGGTLVTAGPAPPLPEDIRGIEIESADPILLFKPTAPTVSFASRAASAPEGDAVVLEVVLDPPAESPVILTYRVGVDDDPETDDADASDYSHGATGSIEIAAGASGASFDIPLADDDDIEPAREVFSVTLDPPGEETGYVRGYPHTAVVTIEEGVCDRTPRIRDEIVAAAGTADCARTDDKDLAGITRLDIRGSSSVASGIPWTPELAARIRRGECEPGTWGVEGTGAATTEATACDSEGGGTESPTTDPRRGSDSGAGAITLREGDFAGLSNLRVLYLLRLGLTELPQGVFAGLDRLSWLSLQHNELTTLPPGVFSDFTNLWNGLILANNRLESFPEGVFSPLTDVFLLILEYNELSEVPAGAFAGLSGVDWLFLNGNRVTGLPAGVFSDMSGLAVLNLANNRLSALPDRPFESLASLKSLYLGGNLLTSVPPRTFAGLSGLRRLGLEWNSMTDLHRGVFSTLPGLTRLWLSGNPLGALQPSDFSDLTNLVDLYLHAIGLSELAPGLFSELAELETLDLRFNQLNELQAGAFLGFRGLKTLGLEGNPGSPFPLTLGPRRTDTSNLLAPGPATVGVGLAQGAPLNLTIGLTVHGGDISASTVLLEAGSDESDEVTVTRPSGSQSGAQVVAGPAPDLPNGVSGIELLVADPLVLFATVSNLAPVPERSVPFLRMRVGDAPHSVDVSTHFRDPDGDDLTFTASSESPDVATATASGSRVTVVPVGAGSARLTVTATDPGGLSAQTSFPVTVRGAIPGSFDIDLILIDEVSRSIHNAFDDAVEYWSAILAGTELPDVPLEDGVQLGCWDITTRQTLPSVDELVIVASVREIDGRSGTLASAGFCGIRDGEGGLPFMGAMQFDVDDLEWLEENGDMEEVILHEMGHVLGIGTAWWRFGLLVNPSLGNPGADTHFPGPLTIVAFDSAGGTNYTGGAKVPVENRAGPGSGDAHWRESVLDHELMTPYQNGGVLDPLSAITIQSLADLGYTVDAGLAEAYRLPGTADVAEPARKIPYGDDILRGPIIVVDRNGRVVRVIPNLPQ